MKARRLVGLSLGLNVLLAAWVVWGPTIQAPPPRLPALVLPRRIPPPPPPPAALSAPASTPTSELQVAPFRWEHVASADFQIYRDRLREIGCPERTVRDILQSEVDRAFAARVEQLLAPLAGRFWEIAADAVHDEDAMEERFEPLTDALQALDDERDAVLESLFGDSESSAEAATGYALSEAERARVGFLSPESVAAYTSVEAEFAARWRDLVQQAEAQQRGVSREEQQAHESARRAAIQALMTPEEFLEYEVRGSRHQNLRNLRGVELTDDELRTVAVLRFQAEQQARKDAANASPGPMDDPILARLRERYGLAPDAATQLGSAAEAGAPADAESEVRALLGDDRYAQLRRAENADFQVLRRFGERAGISSETMESAFEIRQVAQAKAAEILALPQLGAEERNAWIETLRGESEQALQQVLAGEQFDDYRGVIGPWWENLGH